MCTIADLASAETYAHQASHMVPPTRVPETRTTVSPLAELLSPSFTHVSIRELRVYSTVCSGAVQGLQGFGGTRVKMGFFVIFPTLGACWR